MSPRTRKKSAEADVAEAEAETTEEAEKPKKRGRPKNSARRSKIVAADDADTSSDADSDAGSDVGSVNAAVSAEADNDSATESSTTKARKSRSTRRKKSAADEDDARDEEAEASADSTDADDTSFGDTGFGDTGFGDTSSDDDTEEAEADASKRDERESSDSRNRSRGRSNSRSNRKQTLNYRDLQSKILPELHLLAKEVGLSDYRQMKKDDLAVAILERVSESEGLKLVRGYLEISSDGYGFLQESLLQNNTRSVIVSAGLIKQFKLRTGDYIMGKARRPRENERYGTLIRVEAVNGTDPFQASKRPRFDDLTPTFPETRIRLETTQSEVATRVIDLLAPIGRGQRGLIVAPPKAGKTTLLKKVANAVVTNEPDIKLIVLLVDERPEEVTDFRESVSGVEVIASTFDEPPTNHVRVAEFVHERARRIVEDGNHVMILLDSITRLARANNLVTPPTGRTLSGGLDSSALHWPKRFLGAARNIRGGGSLSILATALIETGSRMDDVIFEEFKGTGNMELHLSRRLEERRIFPALDILKSGTRREDLLLGENALAKMWLLRKVMSDMDPAEAMDMLLSRLGRTDSNEDFLSTLGQG